MYAFVSFCMHESSTASLVNAYSAFRRGGHICPPPLPYSSSTPVHRPLEIYQALRHLHLANLAPSLNNLLNTALLHTPSWNIINALLYIPQFLYISCAASCPQTTVTVTVLSVLLSLVLMLLLSTCTVSAVVHAVMYKRLQRCRVELRGGEFCSTPQLSQSLL